MTLAIAVKKTGNKKVGVAAATHVAQISCPPDCCFKDHGCYAELGQQGWTTKRLNQAALGATPLDVALAEAEEISRLSGKLPLRLHVVGDCPDEECARIVAAAADEYRSRHEQPVWTYTHAWRVVPREAWGQVSVLASCETLADVAEAHELGYATALVVGEHFETDNRHTIGGLVDVIPCVEQTHNIPCTDCRLCFNDDFLLEKKRTIGFVGHGPVRLVRKALEGRQT